MLSNHLAKAAIKNLRSKSSGGMVSSFKTSLANTNRHAAYGAFSSQAVTDNFVNGTSAVYVDYVYEQWKANPNSVHASWKAYFEGIEKGSPEPFQAPPTLGQ